MLVDFGSSSGWWIKAEVKDNHEFFTKVMATNWRDFLSDIWKLNQFHKQISIDEFKTRWEIDDLKELHYSAEGDISPFSIVDNEYVQKQGSVESS